MRTPETRRAAVLLILLVALTLAAVGHWYRLGRPVAVAEPGAERLECLSYAPFRLPGESPFDPNMRVSEARIETDLRILAARTDCVRTYSVQHGLEAVPRVARRLGMKVMLGVWIGRDRIFNDAELTTAIRVAREHADVVRALVVGNEVMLRREIPEADLVAYIERARREVPVPVTYADVWEFWLKHPSIAPAVSFVTIHILPYWEDEPVGIDEAIPHVVSIYRKMQAELPGRELLIGETGWPSAGRARRDAVPGRVEQARFIRQFSRVAHDEGIPYNLIEAFDQPWKRALEGAMGGNWGVYDSAGQLKFPWHGPVAERPQWRVGLWAALAGAAIGATVIGIAGVARRRSAGAAVALHALTGGVAGAGLGAVMAEQWHYLQVWNRGPLEWTVTLAATVAAVLFVTAATVLIARRIADGFGEHGRSGDGRAGNSAAAATAAGSRTQPVQFAAAAVLPPTAAVLRGWRRDRNGDRLAGWTAVLLAVVLFGAALTVVLHGFDARYRGFPWPLFAAPVAALVLLRLAGVGIDRAAIEERWLAAVIAVGAVVMAVTEGSVNHQALAYSATMGVLAAGVLWPRASTSRPSSAPTAAGS